MLLQKITCLSVILTVAWAPAAWAFRATEAARCASYYMARSDLESNPKSASLAKTQALTFSSVAIRMGLNKAAVMGLVNQEREIWRGQMVNYVETQDLLSKSYLENVEALCNSIRQEAPELAPFR